MPKPSDPAVATPSGPANIWRVEPGSTATVAVVTGLAAVSNTEQVGVADTGTLSDYVNDVGISPDTNRGCGAFDDGTDTYSADAFATASPVMLTPDAHVTAGGLTFSWPDALGLRPGREDQRQVVVGGHHEETATGRSIHRPPVAGTPDQYA